MREGVESIPARTPDSMGLSGADWSIIESADQFLENAILLRNWQRMADRAGSYGARFDLERTYNRPDRSYGFFGAAPLTFGVTPVMGSVQEMFYDQARAPGTVDTPGWMRTQIREFVLKYFMRVSSFRAPEAAVESRPSPPAQSRFSWCPEQNIQRKGFGFSQLYYKLRNGFVGKFAPEEQYRIIDLRELRGKYEWIVAKVRIFDFNFGFRPLSPRGPELVFALNEESYLILHSEFIVDEANPSPDVLGRYGLGYGFIGTPGPSAVAYGPGQFRAAVELIQFEVNRSARVEVKMTFVVNRPDRIAQLELSPVELAFNIADFLSFGVSSKLLGPLQRVAESFPLRFGPFDPVYVYVSLANALTGGSAARELCISREQLDKRFLMQHFIEHYNTIVGSLLTWRQIPDWLDEKALPAWVVTGRSS